MVRSVLCLAIVTAACSGPEARPRSAVLIVFDTLRADRTSLYGGSRSTTPALERLADDGVVFERAVTNATWTLPAMAALVSGRYVDATVLDGRLRESLVERLRAAGYRTAAFTEGGFVSRRYGFDLGFDAFREQRFVNPLDGGASAKRSEGRDGRDEIAVTFTRAMKWLDGVGDAPFFLLVHTYEPHTPYLRDDFLVGLDPDGLAPRFGIVGAALAKRAQGPISPARIDYIRALYDGGVAESDRWLGRLLDHLDVLGLADETLIVVTSDHGEDLGDRDPPMPGNHGHALYDEQSLVPLVVRDPTLSPAAPRVPDQVRTVDTLPTILDRLGVGAPPEVEGRSLAPLMRGQETGDRLAWMRVVRELPGESTSLHGLRTGRYKLVVDESGRGRPEDRVLEVYDLERDPGERTNLAETDPATRAALVEALGALRARVESGGLPRLRVDADAAGRQAERLRALGYIE